MNRPQNIKFNMSFLDYLNEQDISNKVVSIDEIKRRFPMIAKNNLEIYKMFLSLNNEYLTEQEIKNVKSTIQLYHEQENQKFINAVKYIEQCQKNQQE
tara:strand:- start:890 stop:1183 length:294 start_codon:yes stop_codon:yes gene_type:complete